MAPPLSYALVNLPRYTSYPTAPHMQPLDAAAYAGWLREVGPRDRLSLYLHIPFCQALCWYCGCHTSVTRNGARLSRYATALEAEATLLAAALPAHGGVSAVHFGGGTPTAIGGPAVASVVARLRQEFGLLPDAEVAAELDPRTLDSAMLEALAEAGLTRASLGLQDIAPEVQRRIGRIQTETCVQLAVRGLRAGGVTSVNLDLMYGLPGQTVEHVQESARFAASLKAERVAVFGYAHVPWMKPHQNAIDTAALPGALERLQQAQAAEAVLLVAGYEAVGLDHYALPADAMAVAARAGTLRRNFQGYTTDTAPVLLGLGASSIGLVPQGLAQDLPDEKRWLAAVESGTLPIVRGLAFTEDDRVRGHAIERVMCDMALDLAALPAEVVAEAMPTLRQLEADGVVALAPGWLQVLPEGRRHLRHVAAAFDAYLGKGTARHSAAV